MLAYILGVVLFALGICVSVALHEAGHMATAKAFGMKVRRYFLGFGPTIFSWRRGETEYGLKAIPLGGFCDIAGMTAMDEVTPEESPRSMWRFKVWKRTVVLVAGSVTHFILGFIVLYLLAATLGLPNLSDKPSIQSVGCVQDAKTSNDLKRMLQHPHCAPSDPAPAKQAGIKPGDVITAVNGKPVDTFDQIQAVISKASGPVALTVERDDKPVNVTVDAKTAVRPKIDPKTGKDVGTKSQGFIGVGFATVYPAYGAGRAVPATVEFTGDMFAKTWQGLMRFPQKIPAVVRAIMGEKNDPQRPVSVVGASRLGGEAVQLAVDKPGSRGSMIFWLLLASLNFFVGVFNLLPLLPLDGGHIAVCWYEKIRDWIRRARGLAPGGPADYTKLSMVTMVVVVLGGCVVLLTVIADIVNPITLQ